MQTPSTANDEVMRLAMEEAQRIARSLIETRLRGLQRKVIAPKDRQIAELKRRLAEYESQEAETND